MTENFQQFSRLTAEQQRPWARVVFRVASLLDSLNSEVQVLTSAEDPEGMSRSR